jgi:hypothetical protein
MKRLSYLLAGGAVSQGTHQGKFRHNREDLWTGFDGETNFQF